jgi:hypothetical protein
LSAAIRPRRIHPSTARIHANRQPGRFDRGFATDANFSRKDCVLRKYRAIAQSAYYQLRLGLGSHRSFALGYALPHDHWEFLHAGGDGTCRVLPMASSIQNQAPGQT